MKTFKEQQKLSEKDMTAISSWKKKIKKVKGLTKDQMQILSTLPTPVITALINQVGMVVAHNDPLEEKLVASDLNILDSILSKIKDDITKDKIKGRFEKSWPKMQALARMAGYGITKKMQGKNKSYLWKLKK
tara:strand:+ start:1538 stop:1933 length:396 start_codon:yes stop_codon:yes gene_type:complete